MATGSSRKKTVDEHIFWLVAVCLGEDHPSDCCQALAVIKQRIQASHILAVLVNEVVPQPVGQLP